jgi:hypothetical protein
VLPCRRNDGRIDWYGVARSERELRALREELRAFVGPTYAGFRGERAHLDPADPVEAAVDRFTGGRAFRLAAPPGKDAQQALWRALELMRVVRARRVERRMDVPRTTARALYDFRMALAAGDRAEAEAHLRYLRDWQRLDALNLLSLRVQMLAELGGWKELLELPELPTLLEVRRPFSVSQALVGAVYHEEVAPFESLDDPASTAGRFTEEVLPRFAPLYTMRAGMRTVEALKSFMLVAVAADPADPRLRDEILATGGVPEADRALLSRFATLLPTPAPEREENVLAAAVAAAMRGDLDAAYPLALSAPPSVERTRVLLQCADQFGTLEAERVAVGAVRGLAEVERTDLFRIRRDRRLWTQITGRGGDDMSAPDDAVVPADWSEWLALLNSGASDPDRIREMARRGATEWSVGALVDTPGAAVTMAARLAETRPPANEAALRDSLPFLLAFLQGDAGWPRPELDAVYDALRTLLVMECRGGEAELNLFLDLAGALLSLGADSDRYGEMVSDGIELWARFAAPRTVTWALDLVDLLTAHPSASDEARLRLLVAVAERLRSPQIAPRLDAVQQDFFRALCRDLAHPELSRDLARAADADDDPVVAEEDAFGRLVGRSVAIYTLTESVGHRVREVLLDRCPTASVELCHDHVCTRRLRALAQEADIFLVVTGSAKHAATECIEEHRGAGLPLLRPTGRGSASMLAALQVHLGTTE